MIRILTLFSFMIISQSALAQLDSIFDQGSWRTFIVHLPSSYQSNIDYPLVVNLHGLNSDAAQQENYSKFDSIADIHNFIVVYPNAISGSWLVNGSTDVDFISHLVDTIRNNYSCSNCLFITGMSQGGFLTYKLACSLTQNINAIAVVSGNMSQNLLNTCVISGGLPVMHFHGTNDPLVNYNGTIGIAPVDTTINWWVNQNNCNLNPSFNALPDINTSDSCNVEEYYYSGGLNGSEVTFYKVINGGHTWPGGTPIPPFGFTNMDIYASQIIGDFFSQYCSSTSAISETVSNLGINIQNPFYSIIKIESKSKLDYFELSNSIGQLVWSGENINEHDFSYLQNGLYFLKVTSLGSYQTVKLVKQ